MRALLIAMLMAGSGAALGAQQPFSERLLLADAPGAWVVEVTTTGGFAGGGSGNFAIRADGATFCSAPLRCVEASAAQLTKVADTIGRLTTTAWVRPTRAGGCFDCITTTLTLRNRESDGGERTTTFSWNVVDMKDLPADVRSVYDAAMSMARRGR
jgi:hypothetical protein